jgi:hypothetical protein
MCDDLLCWLLVGGGFSSVEQDSVCMGMLAGRGMHACGLRRVWRVVHVMGWAEAPCSWVLGYSVLATRGGRLYLLARK